jgi:hypothetical protein
MTRQIAKSVKILHLRPNLNSSIYVTDDITGISWHASKFTRRSLGSTQSQFNCCNIWFITPLMGSPFYGVDTLSCLLWFYMLLSVIQLLTCFQRIILSKSIAIEHAHIRDVDYNPKKQNIIVSMIYIFLSRMIIHTSYIYTERVILLNHLFVVTLYRTIV